MQKELIQATVLVTELRRSFIVINKGRVLNIAFDEVTHVRKFGIETIIYTTQREYRTKYSLQDIQHELPTDKFFRLHRSHIVSLKYLDGVKQDRVRIGETFLQLSNYYKVRMIAELSKQLDQLIQFHCGT